MAKRRVGTSLVGPVVVFGLSCASFWVSTQVVRLPPAWYTFEFCQYAEIGKNLATEGSFDTRLVEPMALAYIDAHRVGPPGPRWPVINRYPLPCVVIAGLMTVFGADETAAAWSNGLAAGGLAVLAYVLALRWYGASWAALVGLLVVADPAFYGAFVLLGTPDVWFALVFGLELLAWCHLVEGGGASPSRRAGLAALTGVSAGLAYLTRFNVVVFLAPQGAVLLLHRRWRDAAVAGAAAAAVAAPIVVYNFRHFGRPTVGVYSAWNLLDGIGAYAVEPWLYYREPDVAAVLRAHLGGFAAKFATNLTAVVPFRIWSLWRLDLILPTAVLGLVILIRGRRRGGGGVERRFLTWAAGLFVGQLVLFSGLRLELEDRLSPHHGRYFFWFAVPAILLGVGALRRLDGWSRRWRALTALVVAGQLGLFAWGWSGWVGNGPVVATNLGRDPIRGAIAEMLTDGQVIASNQPQITAWFCARRSIALPADPSELGRLNRLSPTPIDYVFIDLNYNAIDLDPRWAALARPGAAGVSPWERTLLVDYEYTIPPERTRPTPVPYVLLRRRGVPPSRLERSLASGVTTAR